MSNTSKIRNVAVVESRALAPDPHEDAVHLLVDDGRGDYHQAALTRSQVAKQAARQLGSLLKAQMGAEVVARLVADGYVTPSELEDLTTERAIRLATLRRRGVYPMPRRPVPASAVAGAAPVAVAVDAIGDASPAAVAAAARAVEAAEAGE